MAVFEKGIRLRHIGHLDIQRAMMRALRRSGLPVAYSNGYNPHILLTFASALSTGAAGKKEILDVTMAREVSPGDFLQQMNRALPPDLQLSFARALDDKHPAMMALVQAADYTLNIADANAAAKMIAAIPDFLQQTSILAIRPLLVSLSGEGTAIHAVMVLTETLACKPDMLLSALSTFCGQESAPNALIIRNGLLGRDENGELTPLENL
jgi:radical SAM-linked protein